MDARLTQRRLLSLAAIAAAAALTSACGGGGDAQAAAKDPPSLPTYSSSVLSFSYPAAWTASKPILPADAFHFHPLVYLSTQPVQSPCTKHGKETVCGLPVKRLQPGGVVASWQFAAFPIMGPSHLPGKQIRVDGHRAGLTETAGGECRSIGADRTIQAAVDLSSNNTIFFTACLRGPGLAQEKKSVEALLASTKFPSQ